MPENEMSKYVVSRKAYEQVWTINSPLEGVDDYPKSTADAMRELRDRGYDATQRRLDYALDKQHLYPAPRVVGGVRVWTRQDIDRLATVLDGNKAYTWLVEFFFQFNIDADEFFVARGIEGLDGAKSLTIHPDGSVQFTPWRGK